MLNGGTGNDRLEGGAGADTLNGGSGRDYASYLFATKTSVSGNRGVNVNLATGRGAWGDAEGDRYSGIEHVIGSRFDDTITGDSEKNVIFGLEGADTIDGGGEPTPYPMSIPSAASRSTLPPTSIQAVTPRETGCPTSKTSSVRTRPTH